MSAGTYKINSEPQQGRTYDGRYGEMRVWLLSLENAKAESASGLFELHQKPDTRAPQVGDTIDVERFIQGDFNGEPYVKIKKAWSGQGGGSGGSGGSAGGGDSKFDRRPEHPRNEARMIHTSALSAAPAYINQMVAFGLEVRPGNEQEYWALVSRVAKKLTASYQAPMGRAEEPPQKQAGGPQGEVPADRDGLEQRSLNPDAAVPF